MIIMTSFMQHTVCRVMAPRLGKHMTGGTHDNTVTAESLLEDFSSYF